MAHQMTWDQDQQCYRGEIKDQSSGYLLAVEVDGDEYAETLAGLGEAEAMLRNPAAWVEYAGVNAGVRVERARPLTDAELSTPRDFYQPGDTRWAAGDN